MRNFLALMMLSASLVSVSGKAIAADSDVEVRGYMASINGRYEKDLLIHVAANRQVFVAPEELSPYLDSSKVKGLSRSLPGCSPCVSLGHISNAEIIESQNLIRIEIFDEYRAPQRIRRGHTDTPEPINHGELGLALRTSLITRIDERADEELSAFDLDLGLSLAEGGNIYTSVVYFDNDQYIRGSSYYEKVFADAMWTLQLGDISQSADTFGGSVRLGGIRLRRSFDTNPAFNFRPEFKYQTSSRLPGTLELFVDGQRVKQEQYDRGQLSIEGSVLDVSRGVSVVLTDALGNRRVARASLFDARNHIAVGVVDADFSFGLARDGNRYSGEVASAYLATGISNGWTQSISVSGEHGVWQASSEAIIGLGAHNIELGASSSDDRNNGDGEAYKLGYSYDWQGDDWWANAAVDVFDAKNLAQVRGAPVTADGATAGFSFGSDQFYLGASVFEVAGLSGGSFVAGTSSGEWFLESSAEYLENDEYLATLTIGYRPREKDMPRYRFMYGKEREEDSVGADVFGSFGPDHHRLSYHLAVEQALESAELSRRASFSYRGNSVEARFSHDRVDRFARHSGRISSGFVVNRHGIFASRWPVSQAYAVVDTLQPDAVLKSAGNRVKSNSNGVALLPVSPYMNSTIKMDRESVWEGNSFDIEHATTRLGRGAQAHIEMAIRQSPIIIHILHNGVNDIYINGRPYIHNDYGAYITRYRPNEINTITVDGKSYSVKLPLVSEELPVYEFDRSTGKLIKSKQLFKG